MRTFVYVDGLNLYYGCLKGTPYKWLNLKLLSEKVLGPKNEIAKIKLFTTIVKPTPSNPSVHHRQISYLNALKHTVPELEIYYGHFLEHVVTMRRETVIKGEKFVNVIKREEKGSDVNLAVHFLSDALLGAYDCGVIISNDSDIAEAVKLASQYTDKTIGIISPFPRASKELKQYSHFQRFIRNSALGAAQLPESIPGTSITKPVEWRTP